MLYNPFFVYFGHHSGSDMCQKYLKTHEYSSIMGHFANIWQLYEPKTGTMVHYYGMDGLLKAPKWFKVNMDVLGPLWSR